MSEVKRYWVPYGTLDDQSGWHPDDNEVVLAGEHDAKLAALREELVGAAILLKAWSDNYAQLEQRLAAAERRNNELSRLLLIAKPYSDGEYRKSIDAALNKPEEAASHDE